VNDRSSLAISEQQSLATYSLFLGMICIEECYFLVFVKQVEPRGKLLGHTVSEVRTLRFVSLTNIPESRAQAIDQSIDNVRKYLSFGFLCSPTYHLSKPLRYQADPSYDSTHFIWNSNITKLVTKLGVPDSWMDKIVQGFLSQFHSDSRQCQYILLSRRSSEMGGTRFHSRGLNEEGYVANFVETEQFLVQGKFISTFVQIRGSPPFFWRQKGVVSPAELTRTYEFAQKYYVMHMQRLMQCYGKVACFNLVSDDKEGEELLCRTFEALVNYSKLPGVTYNHIDFHGVTQGTNFSAINDFLEKHEHFIKENGANVFECLKPSPIDFSNPASTKLLLTQQMVVRTNCVDCLDRTNAFQMKVALLGVKIQSLGFFNADLFQQSLQETDMVHPHGHFMKDFKNVWADHADWVSKIYAGTGATTSSTTRKGKGTLFSLLDHKMKSIGRFYLGNFEDSAKQRAIDIILGKNTKGEMSEELESRLSKIESKFMEKKKINFGVISWTAHLDLDAINIQLFENLLSRFNLQRLDVFALGIQEAVKTGGMNIFGSKTDINDVLARYENELAHFFAVKGYGMRKFSSYKSGEVITIVFARDSFLHNLGKDSFYKIKFNTGLKGAFQKKHGALIQKFNIFDTTVTLVNANLCSGKDDSEGRANQIGAIFENAFQNDSFGQVRSETIKKCSDVIILFGSLNFRLNASDIHIRNMCNGLDALENDNYTREQVKRIHDLTIFDEFLSQRDDDPYLGDFTEAKINFAPTYKFDPKTRRYNEKDKFVSSWADRILYHADEDTICYKYGSLQSVKLSTHL
jgi:hypothetical protein